MDLSSLRPAPGARRSKKRVGRGPGSGLGKTAGRGHKGRKSRSGGNTPAGYEGGQMPLQRRLPKRGFRNPFRVEFETVNLGELNRFADGAVVDPAALVEAGLARRLAARVPAGADPSAVRHRPQPGRVKILADGALERKLTVRAHAFSGAARTAIEALGGVAEVLGGPQA